MTMVVIAYQLSTISNADQVIMLGEGKIIQKGNFDRVATKK